MKVLYRQCVFLSTILVCKSLIFTGFTFILTPKEGKQMKKSFDHIQNSWLYRLSKVIGDVVIISCLFLLFCLPVVTIGASVTALYYTVYRKYKKHSDEPSKDFMRSLKENLKNGIIINLIYMIFCAIAGFNIYFAFFGFGGTKLPDWYTIVSLVPLLPVIFTLPFVYPARSSSNTCRSYVSYPDDHREGF